MSSGLAGPQASRMRDACCHIWLRMCLSVCAPTHGTSYSRGTKGVSPENNGGKEKESQARNKRVCLKCVKAPVYLPARFHFYTALRVGGRMEENGKVLG